MSRIKSAALKDVEDISISPIFWGHKYYIIYNVKTKTLF